MRTLLTLAAVLWWTLASAANAIDLIQESDSRLGCKDIERQRAALAQNIQQKHQDQQMSKADVGNLTAYINRSADSAVNRRAVERRQIRLTLLANIQQCGHPSADGLSVDITLSGVKMSCTREDGVRILTRKAPQDGPTTDPRNIFSAFHPKYGPMITIPAGFERMPPPAQWFYYTANCSMASQEYVTLDAKPWPKKISYGDAQCLAIRELKVRGALDDRNLGELLKWMRGPPSNADDSQIASLRACW